MTPAETDDLPRLAGFDGLDLAYLDEGQGPLVVLLHGFGSDHRENWVDTGVVARTLAEDVVVRTRAGTVQGVEAAERHARERHVEDRSQSVISDILIDLHGDRAAARANLTATFVPDASNPGLIYTVGEWYQFSLTRTPQGWRFARIEANPIWRTEDPSVAR